MQIYGVTQNYIENVLSFRVKEKELRSFVNAAFGAVGTL